MLFRAGSTNVHPRGYLGANFGAEKKLKGGPIAAGSVIRKTCWVYVLCYQGAGNGKILFGLPENDEIDLGAIGKN